MHQFFIVDKNHKSRGFYRHLSDIVEPQSLSLIRRRLLEGHGLTHDLIEYSGGHSQVLILPHHIDDLKHLFQPLTRDRGDENDLCIGHKGQSVPDLPGKLIDGLIVFNGEDFTLMKVIETLVGNPEELKEIIGDVFDKSFAKKDEWYHSISEDLGEFYIKLSGKEMIIKEDLNSKKDYDMKYVIGCDKLEIPAQAKNALKK